MRGRLITLPTPLALASAGVIQRALRLAPGDNEINTASARYLLRTGTYSIEKARRVGAGAPMGEPDRRRRWVEADGHA